MLLVSSRAGTHSVAPFFFAVTKGVTSFHSFAGASSHWTDMKFCSLSDQILLFNPAFEIAWNSH